MPLPPKLQALFDEIMAAHPEGLTLDELSDELVTRPVSYAEIDQIIGALEDAGVDLEAPPRPARPEQLVQVLAAARALAQETGKRPSAEQIAARTGLPVATVKRALELGLTLGR